MFGGGLALAMGMSHVMAAPAAVWEVVRGC